MEVRTRLKYKLIRNCMMQIGECDEQQADYKAESIG